MTSARATSYIPTTGSVVSRAYDLLTATLGSEFNDAAQTALFSFRVETTPDDASNGILWSWVKDANNLIVIRLSGSTLLIESIVGGVSTTLGTFPVRGRVTHKVAAGFGNGTLRLAVDGGTAESTGVTLPTGFVTRLIGGAADGTQHINGAVMPHLPAKGGMPAATEYKRLLTLAEMAIYTENYPVMTYYGTLVGFGDSFTAGSNASNSFKRFINVVSSKMGAGTSPLNKGVSGTIQQNSNDGTGNPKANNGESRYVADTLGSNKRLGVIDGYGGFNDVRTVNPGNINLANFIASKRTMWDGWLAGGYSRLDIVCCSIWWMTDAQLAVESISRSSFEAYHTALHNLAIEYGVYWADVYAAMRDNGGAALIDTDNIHPVDTGHAVIADAIMAATVAHA